jgi:hypothetical protein
MKENNPPKKLRFLKKTIAHLDNEHLNSARGGDPQTKFGCISKNPRGTVDCPTVNCETNFCLFTQDCD